MKSSKTGFGSLVTALITFSLVFAFSSVGVFALHDAKITIDPSIANCEELGDTFTVNIENDGSVIGADDIFEVRIYSGTYGIEEFACGSPPGGWRLYDMVEQEGYCEYKTNWSDIYVIEPGESLDFNFTATMWSEECYSEFLISTLDNKRPVGEHEYNWPQVRIDCTPPEIVKTVGDPKIIGDGFNWWVTNNTLISLSASDDDLPAFSVQGMSASVVNGDCNLGMDYCRWRIIVDGVPGEWNIQENGDTPINWQFKFLEDSNHDLEVECYDIAGNKNTLNEKDKVDSTPPDTTKVISDPKKIENGVEWVDTVTTITLNPVDPDPSGHDCDIGVDKTWYANVLAECDDSCWDSNKCTPVLQNPYDNPDMVECINEMQLYCDENWETGQYSTWEACVEDYAHKECRLDPIWHLYDGTPISKDEESCHILQFFSVDNIGNVEDMNVNCFFVDKTPPKMEKTIDGPSMPIYDDIEQLGNGMAEWTEDDSYTGSYSAKLIIPDASAGTDFAGVDSFFDVFIGLNSIKSLSYYRKVTQYDNGWSPIIILGIDSDGDGTFEAQPLEWEASLTSGSADPALLGDDTFIQCEAPTGLSGYDINFVQVDVYNDFKCYTPNVAGDNYDWSAYDLLSYFQNNAVGKVKPTDKVAMVKVELGGNPTTQDNEIAYVDTVEMNGNTLINEPSSWWVKGNGPAGTDGTGITMSCTDQDPHPSGGEEVCYKVSYDLPEKWTDITSSYCPEVLEEITQEGYQGQWCCIPSPKTITFKEDSMHDLEYFCRDAVDKKSMIDLEYFKVDSRAPIISKTMIGNDHLGQCPPEEPTTEEPCYVKDSGENGVSIDVQDDASMMGCAVDHVFCTYEVWWMNQNIQNGQFGEKGANIIFTKDSEHTLKVNCQDALGNAMPEDIEKFLVDSTPPVTTKTYGNPTIVKGAYRWITSATPITINAIDAKVGVDDVFYRVTPLSIPDESCIEACTYAGTGAWNEIEADQITFTIPQDSCHMIEFYSVDKLGNDGSQPNGPQRQCVFVDNKAPITDKIIGTPKVVDDEGTFITQQTPITLTCTDQTPHPVDSVVIKYRYKINDGAFSEWMNYTAPFTFPQDSMHTLEYYCADALGNTEVTQSEIDIVDTVPPEISTTVIGPHVGTCPELQQVDGVFDVTQSYCFIDGVTKIHVEASDPEPHPVNDVKCEWSYTVDGGSVIVGGTGIVPPFDINFPEESLHMLTIRCADKLGNAAVKEEVYRVDKTPPVTTKSYGEPKFIGQNGEWVGITTPITLTVEDAGPHKSGIKETKYRVTKIPDIYCNESLDTYCAYEGSGLWQTYTGQPFKISEQSCHKIEYYSVDNVDKKEVTKYQCVYVDNTAPDPVKVVGEPKTPWDGKNAKFYNITDFCTTAGNCWMTTILTPITLECVDAQPHPVDHETVCFKVELDAVDATSLYCDESHYNGSLVMREDRQYCCLDKELEEPFYFGEVSEHNLAYYCVDALGNTGPVDDEKFKVEETAFEIELNRKWNLISVPVKLLDGSMDQAFKDVADTVKAVWTYDGKTEEWSVYTPNDDSSDDTLTTMLPGWGYWVLSNADDMLVIGGSLMSPAMVPPSKPIVAGWNLVGYYGAEGAPLGSNGYPGYYGPDGYGKPAKCALNSLGISMWDKGFTSLWTYWEQDNPDMWKDLNKLDSMDPGAGYWLLAQEDGLYAPSTTCI